MLRKIMLAAAMAVVPITALPSPAIAHDHGWYDGDDDDGWDHDHGHHWGHAYGHYRDRGYDQEQGYYRDYRPYHRCHRNDTTGLILGGAGGALIGRALDPRGDHATGTILGAGAGALLGREVARNNCR